MNPITRFFQGLQFFLSGIGMLFRYPKLFGLSLIPILLTIVVLLGLAGGAAWLVGQRLRQSALFAAEGQLLLQAIVFLFALFIAYLIYLPLTRIFLAPFSERISRKTLELSGANTLTQGELSFFRSIWEGVKLVSLQVVIAVIVLLLTLLLPPLGIPLGIFITICFCGVDFLDVPLSLHRLSLREKLGFLWRNRAFAFGFAVAGYVLLHIPLVNLIALPVGVIGATRLIHHVISVPVEEA